MQDVKQHQAKAGTPASGECILYIVAVVVSFLLALFAQQLTNNVGMDFVYLDFVWFGGFDDFLKFSVLIEGLNPKQKLALQLGEWIFIL